MATKHYPHQTNKRKSQLFLKDSQTSEICPSFYWSKLGIRLSGLSYDIGSGVDDNVKYSSKMFLYNSLTMFIIFILCTHICMTLFSAWKFKKYFQKTTILMMYTLFSLYKVIEMLIFLRNINAIKIILSKLKNNFVYPRKHMINTALTADVNKSCKIFICRLFLSRIVSVLVMSQLPIVSYYDSLAAALPYSLWYPFDISDVPYSMLVYSLEITIVIFNVLITTGLDALYYDVVMHLCGCLRQLNHSLLAVSEDMRTTNKTQPRQNTPNIVKTTEPPKLRQSNELNKKRVRLQSRELKQPRLKERATRRPQVATITIQADVHDESRVQDIPLTSLQNIEKMPQVPRGSADNLDVREKPKEKMAEYRDKDIKSQVTIEKIVDNLEIGNSNKHKLNHSVLQGPSHKVQVNSALCSYNLNYAKPLQASPVNKIVVTDLEFDGSHDIIDIQDVSPIQKLAPQPIVSIVDCIQQHQAIIKISEDFRTFITLLLKLQSLIMIAAFGVLSFQVILSYQAGNYGNTMKFSGMTLMLYSRYFLYCWLGDELKTKSEEVAFAAYSTPWCEASNSFKVCVQMMMMRAQRPLTLVAGKLNVISLTRFHKVLQASYDCVAFLQNVNPKQENRYGAT